jgi:hypothetical protein
MLRIRLLALAVVGVAVVRTGAAATFTEDFTSDPLQHGWQVYGNTNLFQWDAIHHRLAVTWDSREPNSYFYFPLGTTLTRYDDFSLEFDLVLTNIACGVEPGKTGSMQLGFGFLNFAQATSGGFQRGAFGGAPNVAEFDYYAHGYYDYGGVIFDAPATTTPSFISGVDSFHYAPNNLGVYANELPLEQPVHVRLVYAAASQTVTVTLTADGVPLGPLPPLVLDPAHGFVAADDVRVDMFSISSYSSAGDYFDSLLAHGSVANVSLTTQTRPVGAFNGALVAPGLWEALVFTRTGWTYTLERADDLQHWTAVSPATKGADADITLRDLDAPATRACYRVRAEQP